MSRLELQPLSRRATLLTGSASIAAALSGCRSGASGTNASASGGVGADVDQGLVRQAHALESRLRRDALRAARRHGALEGTLRRAAEVHGAHVDLLERSLDVVGRSSGWGAVARDPRAAARGLARDEHAVADAHARAALEARSGPLARVLAGMAASADQQAHLLATLAVSAPRRG